MMIPLLSRSAFFVTFLVVLSGTSVLSSISGAEECSGLDKAAPRKEAAERVKVVLPEGTVIPPEGVRLFQVSEVDSFETPVVLFKKTQTGYILERTSPHQPVVTLGTLTDDEVVITLTKDAKPFHFDGRSSTVEVHFVGWGYNSSLAVKSAAAEVKKDHALGYKTSQWTTVPFENTPTK